MEQKEITIRNLKDEDLPQIKNLLYDTWIKKDYGENEEVANEISSIFMYELLYRQTFSNVAIYKNKVVGIILGRINKCYKLKNNTTYIVKLILHCLKTILIKGGIKALKSEKEIAKVNNELLNNLNTDTDGELVLFALNKNIKGKGLGSKLLNSFYDYMKENNADKFYLFTDTTCDYSFYDHNGFKRESSKNIYFKKEPETYFIYTKKLT